MVEVPALAEGHLDAVFLPVLLRQLGRHDLSPIVNTAGGGARFWSIAKRYNEAGRHKLVLGLADLEQAPCVPGLIADKLLRLSPGFKLRVAVRMLESWLLADRGSLSSFLRAPIALFPSQPDVEVHPKRKLVDIARKSSARAIRDAMVPGDSGAIVGPEYVAMMEEYIREHWQVEKARQASPSLERACTRWSAV